MGKYYDFIISIVALVLFPVCHIDAKTVYVSSKGSDANDGLSTYTPLATLDKAMQTIASGDIVSLTGIIHPSSTIVVNGLTDLTFVGGDESVSENVIDGNSGVQLFVLKNNSQVTMRNLTLRGGKVTADNVSTACQGGAIHVDHSSLTIEGSDLYNHSTRLNAGDQGGAIYVDGGTLSVSKTTFYGNYSYQGGALYAINTNLALTDVTIEANETKVDTSLTTKYNEARGGGACIVNCITRVQRCTFIRNISTGDAGSLWILTNSDGKSFEANQCAFVDNRTGGEDSRINGMHGGAIMYSAYSPITAYFRSCTIALNTTSSAGGALFYTGDTAGSVLDFINCTITKNSTLTGVGNSGGMNIVNRSNATVNFINSIVEGNLCNDGWSDTAFGTSAHISFKNSIVGLNSIPAGVTSTVSFDEAGRYNTTQNNSVTELTSGIVPQMDCDNKCFALQTGYIGTTIADLLLAHDYGCDEDQLGVKMNLPCVGAVQRYDGDEQSPTAISFADIPNSALVDVYSTSGVRIASGLSLNQLNGRLPAGLYIVVGHGDYITINRKIIINH